MVSDALRLCSPDANRKGWIGWLATELNVSDRSVEAWLYGESPPSACALTELCRLLGKRFADAVLIRSGLVTFRKELAEAVNAETVLAAETLCRHVEHAAADFRKAAAK